MANEVAKVVKETKKMKYERILPLVASDEVLYSFIQGEISALERKAERTSTTPTKEQVVMASLMEVVEGALTGCDEPKTASEIIHLSEVDNFAKDNENYPLGISTQRMTSCLHKLVASGKVEKVEGKPNKFRLPQE